MRSLTDHIENDAILELYRTDSGTEFNEMIRIVYIRLIRAERLGADTLIITNDEWSLRINEKNIETHPLLSPTLSPKLRSALKQILKHDAVVAKYLHIISDKPSKLVCGFRDPSAINING